MERMFSITEAMLIHGDALRRDQRYRLTWTMPASYNMAGDIRQS